MRCGRGASTTRRSLRRVSCERAAATVSVIAPVGLGGHRFSSLGFYVFDGYLSRRMRNKPQNRSVSAL